MAKVKVKAKKSAGQNVAAAVTVPVDVTSPVPPSPELRLEWRDPSELTENPKNWRRHPESQLAALSDVIAEVGWAGACLFNERTGRLVDGHARQKVAVKNGSKKVPVLVGSWSEEDEAKILATLDPIAGMATADAATLDALLASISTDSPAISQMLEELSEAANEAAGQSMPAAGAGGDEFDATPEATGPTRTAVGNVWVIGGKHRLLVGDCTDAGNVLLLLNGAKPHLMVTDPPYGVEYDPDWRNKATRADGTPIGASAIGEVTNDSRCDWLQAWNQFHGEVAYVWHAGRYAGEVQRSLEESGFEIRSQIIWAKNNFAIGRGDYHWKHEPCWYAVRTGKTAHYNGDRSQTTLWEIDKPQKSETGHSTQKPIECMSKPIENNSNPGDIIYDPFLGSGTTMVAAHRLNRLCFGCEIEPRYADVILKRMEAEGLSAVRVEEPSS